MHNPQDAGFRFYAPQLDALRFIAALLVFLHHAPALPHLGFLREYGWVGVDLFFVISAFLLTRLLMLEFQRNGTINLPHFFIRRALRIWPLYFFYVTCAVSLALWSQDLALTDIIAWWAGLMTFTNNLTAAISGYSPIDYTAHLWTISLEEQAYIAMPLLLLVYFKSGGGHRVLLGAACGLLIWLLLVRTAFFLQGTPHPFVWVLPLRMDGFVLGAVAALVFAGPLPRAALWAIPLGVALVATCGFFPPVNQASLYQIIGYSVIALGCTCITVGAMAPGMERSILAAGVLRYGGRISFGIYIYHLVGLKIASAILWRLDMMQPGPVVVLGFAITFGMAALSYQVLEKPFLKLKERYTAVASRPLGTRLEPLFKPAKEGVVGVS